MCACAAGRQSCVALHSRLAAALVRAVTCTRFQTSSQQQGAKLRSAAIAIGLGAALRWGLPVPEGLDPEGWTLLAIFLTTVAGLVLEPVAAGAWALMVRSCSRELFACAACSALLTTAAGLVLEPVAADAVRCEEAFAASNALKRRA